MSTRYEREVVRFVPRPRFPKPPNLEPWEWRIAILALEELGRVHPTLLDQATRLQRVLGPLGARD